MSVFITTVFQPTVTIEVSDSEYNGLVKQGLVYSVNGGPPTKFPTLPSDILGAIAEQVGKSGDGRYALRGDTPVELTTSGATGRFLPETSVYNWKSSNTLRFRTALGKAIAGTARCNIVASGESTTAGRGLTNTESAYPAFMRKTLAARGIPLSGNGASRPGRGESAVVDAFTTISSGWSVQGQQSYIGSSTAGSTLTITGTGPTLTLISSNYGSGTFSYAVDGGAATNVSNSGASSLQVTSVTGLSAGAHTVVITVVSGAVNFYSAEFATTTGVSVTNAGSSGSTINLWQPGQFFNNLGATLSHNPHLVLFGMQINDLAAGTAVATFKAGIVATVTAIKAVSDVVLCTSNAASGTWTVDQWSAYNVALYQVADSLDIPLIDVSFRAPSYAVNNAAGLMLDTYHPNANYYAERGNHHARVLLGP